MTGSKQCMSIRIYCELCSDGSSMKADVRRRGKGLSKAEGEFDAGGTSSLKGGIEDKCGRPQNLKKLSNLREFISKNVN